jgi:hypothetical protein
MKFKLLAAGLLSVAMVSPAVAQNAPDDLHCFLLSNFYAKAEKNVKPRLIAEQATMFYLGKIDGKVNPQVLRVAMTAHLVPQIAGPQMMACAQRLGRAEQALQATITSVAPKH